MSKDWRHAILGANEGLQIEGVAGGVAQPVSLATAPALVASEAHIGSITGHMASIDVTPTLTVAATYVANDFVGTTNTPMTFAGAARVAAGSGYVVGAALIDGLLQSVAGELWLFDTAPAGLGADSAAFTITDADAARLIGVVPFSTYYASALNSVSNGTFPNGALPFKCPAGATSIFGAFVTRGAPVYTGTPLTFRLLITQD